MVNIMNQDFLKKQAALCAMQYVEDDQIIGVGTGSTVHYFIEALKEHGSAVGGCVPSSKDTEAKLREAGLPVVDVNAGLMSVYVDGADEFNQHFQLIKGGGGALTREKILAACAQTFVCIVDESKSVPVLGDFGVPVEVIPMARSLVARQIVKLGGDPVYREGVITDNGNQILDVFGLDLTAPVKIEEAINNITGVVCNGLFAKRGADIILVASEQGVRTMKDRPTQLA